MKVNLFLAQVDDMPGKIKAALRGVVRLSVPSSAILASVCSIFCHSAHGGERNAACQRAAF
jgi:hypothetical protein